MSPQPPSSDATPKADAPPTRTPPPGAAGTDPGPTASQPPHSRFGNILAPPQQPDEIGRLGGYRVLRLIGEGGMGFVFEAEELLAYRHVALTVMKPEIAALPEAK